MPVVKRTSSSTVKRYSGDLITHQSSFSSVTTRADYRGKNPAIFRKFGVDMWRASGTIGAAPSLYVKIGSTERSVELPNVPSITPSRLGWTATDLLDFTDFPVSDTPVTLNFRSTSKSLVAVATNSSGVIDRAEYDYIQVPSAPDVKYTKSSTDASKMTVAITEPSDNGGSAVTGYTVEYSTSSSFSSPGRVSISGGGSKSTVVTVPNKGSRYYFRVMAKNSVTAAIGSLGGAASTSYNDVMEILPGAPTISSVTPSSTGKSATVSWSAAATNGGSGAKSYTVKRYSTGGTLLSTNTTTSRSITISNLTPGSTYKYTVTAVNNEGSGPASASVSRTQPTSPSAPGAKYTRSTTDASKVTVAVTAPSNNGGSPITGYTIEYSTSSNFSGSAKVSISGGGSKSATVTVANKGSLYYFRVRAKNAVTDAAGSLGGAASPVWSDVMEILPGKPTISSVTPSGTGKSATVSWSAAPTNGGSGAKSYSVKRYSSGGTLLSTNTTTSRSLTISGLTPGSTYKYTVTAVNNEGSGPASASVSKAQPNVPSQVTGLSITAHPLGRQASLSWNAPSGNGAAITSYEVQITRSGSTTTTQKATSSSLTVTGLVPGSTYLFRVRATNSVGTGAYSAQSAAITMPNPSVSPGDYFDGSTAAADGVTFSWTGTAGKSTSVARVAAPEGWTTFAEAVGSSGGGVVTRSSADSVAGSYCAAVTFWSGLTDTQAAFGLRHTAAIPPLATITGSIFVKTERAQGLRPVLIFADASGNDVSRHYGDPVLVDEGRWTRLVITSPRPAKANEVRASIRVCMAEVADGGLPWYAGEVFYLDAAAITVSSAPYPYFDGSTPDDGQYEYAWTGAANASTSMRTDVPPLETSIDPLLDPDCGPFPTPPRPPSIDVSCIAEVDQWRRYWIDIPAEEQADWTTTLPTFIISTFGRSANQLRLRVYQDAFNNGVTEVTNSEYCSELILSYLPPNVELTLDSLNQRAYANVPGYAEGLPADHLVFGTGGVPPTWPELECGIKYMVSLDVPSDIPVGAVQMKTLLTRRLR